MHDRTVTAAAVNPATFHMDCVDHLCFLESQLQSVRTQAGQGPSMEKLIAFNRILEGITDFADPRFSPDALESIASRIKRVRRLAHIVQKCLPNASWNSMKRLFGQRDANNTNGELLRAYQEMQSVFNRLLVEYFVMCVKRFTTADDGKRAFLESVDAFLSEIERIWN